MKTVPLHPGFARAAMERAAERNGVTLGNSRHIEAARPSGPVYGHARVGSTSASRRPRPDVPVAATTSPKVGTVVQAAVDAKFITDTRESRAEYARVVAANPSKAVIELAGFRSIVAATAKKATPRPRATTPAPVQPNASTYPADWAPARAPQASGVRVGATTSSINVSSAMAPPRVVAGRAASRAPQPISSPRDAAGFIAAQNATADANRLAAQRNNNAHSDPHDLIAATGGQSRAVQAAQTAELERMAALHAKHYG